MDKTGRIFELYAIKSTERNGRAPLEGDVVTDAKDEYDQFNKPCVSMSMNTEGSRPDQEEHRSRNRHRIGWICIQCSACKL